MLLQLACVTAGQVNIIIQHIQNAFAYTLHEFLIAVRNDGFTQFRFGRL